MTGPPATVLHLEDSDLDAELVRDRLAQAGLAVAVDRATDRKGFVARLAARRYDLILSDYQVPAFDGLAALDLARTRQPDTPFVFVSGAMGEELAVESLKRGATDYVLKQRLARLPAVVERALAEARTRADRERAAAELAGLRADSDRRKRLYETILSNTPDLAYVFDLDHRFTYANETLLRLWGKTWDEAIGKTCLELGYPAWHAEMHDREIEEVKATKRPIRGEVPFAGTFGRRIYDYIFVPVLGPDGEVEAVAGTTRDVTERKQAEEDLREQDRRKDEFLATLAHELRNPLAPVRTGLAVLRLSPADAPAAARALDTMDRQLSHMVRLIDDLLDVSRISRGKIELKKARVSVRAVVESAVEAARPAVEAGRHELMVTLPDAPMYLDGDLTRLAQVLSNLLNNAAKYTEPGGRVGLTAEPAGGEVVFRVTDTGVGIPADMLGSVFDLFTQVGRTIDRAQGGLGIGLSLARRLVELHGGTIAADSPGPGRGSTFTVRLPRAAGDGPEAAAPARPARPAVGRRVLVVDDNVDGAETLALMLRLTGHEARTAHSGPAALAAAQEFRPEVVFLDIGMPGMSGYEVARQIRSGRGAPGPLLVAVTGWGTAEDQRRARDAGFDFHLTKPPDLDKMTELLSRLPPAGDGP